MKAHTKTSRLRSPVNAPWTVREGVAVSPDAVPDPGPVQPPLVATGEDDTDGGDGRGGYTVWASITSGWFTSGPRSEWTRRVTQGRTMNQDRIRPYTTRGVLLLLLALSLLTLEAAGWALLWLTLGVIQTALEIALERTLRAEHEQLAHVTTLSGHRFTENIVRGRSLLVRVWYWNYERGITNVTGLLGTVAAVGNVAVVLYGTTATADPPWVRVLALGAAMLYLVSGALGPLADVAMYSPAVRMPRWLTAALRWLWVGVVAAIITLVWTDRGSETSWAATLPYAVMTITGIGAYPMLRCREYERAMTAARDVAKDLDAERYANIALGLHNLLQPVKGTLQIAAQAVPDPADRAELDRFLRDMEYLYRCAKNRTIDLSQGLGMPLEEHLKSLASAEQVRLNIEIHLPTTLASEHSLRVKQWLLMLVHNSVQAYRRWEHDDIPLTSVTATVDDKDIVLQVTDLLGLVPPGIWNNPDSTLMQVRLDVEAAGGTMTQTVNPPMGKTITIRWTGTDPLRKRIIRRTPE